MLVLLSTNYVYLLFISHIRFNVDLCRAAFIFISNSQIFKSPDCKESISHSYYNRISESGSKNTSLVFSSFEQGPKL